MEARMTPANELLNNKRFLAGLMFLAIGAVAIWMAQDYPIGSALRMGPGYFPIVLSGIMILFGIYELVLGIMKSDPVKGNWSIRALIVLPLAAVLFGILMEHGGFIPALVVLVFASAAASNEFKFMEVLISAVVLTIGSVGLFIYGLGLPYPLFSLSGM
jgi:putative tricarboxylic transport membrane protein